MLGKVVVIVKTLNEQRNIASFIAGYSPICDLILVSDGGSTDHTVFIAEQYPNVKVRTFEERVPVGDDGAFMNPEGKHINALIDWACDEGAAWVILDGCDSWPNSHLARDGRRLLAECGLPQVHLHRLMLWGKDAYFPAYNGPGPALWAWMPEHTWVYCETRTNTLFDSMLLGARPEYAHRLDLPYAILHYSWLTERSTEEKLARYASWGHPIKHPIEAYGQPAPLPEELR